MGNTELDKRIILRVSQEFNWITKRLPATGVTNYHKIWYSFIKPEEVSSLGEVPERVACCDTLMSKPWEALSGTSWTPKSCSCSFINSISLPSSISYVFAAPLFYLLRVVRYRWKILSSRKYTREDLYIYILYCCIIQSCDVITL